MTDKNRLDTAEITMNEVKELMLETVLNKEGRAKRLGKKKSINCEQFKQLHQSVICILEKG